MRCRHRKVLCPLLAMLGLLAFAGQSLADDVSGVVILATNSVHLDRDGEVGGDIVVNDEAHGATLVAGYELKLDKGITIVGNVSADTIRFDKNVSVEGEVACNEGTGTTCNGLVLPVFDVLPPFHETVIRPGVEDVLVTTGETLILEPGEYGDILVAEGGTLVLTGGLYQARSIASTGSTDAPCGFPCRALLYAARTEVRLSGRIALDAYSCLGPGSATSDCLAGSFPAAGSEATFYVGGSNGGNGGPHDLPAALRVGMGSVLGANFYAPFGTTHLDKEVLVLGALFGRDIDLDKSATVLLASAFANQAPTADPQDVFTEGTSSLEILLTGSDPEDESLTFSIADPPELGILQDLEDVPSPGECSETSGACLEDDDCPDGEICLLPPIVSARVTYVPDDPLEELEDGFVFQVEDPNGNNGEAQVNINTAGDPTDPPPIETVTAFDALAETLEATPVVVTLEAEAPAGVDLTFTIESDPAGGVVGNPMHYPPSTARVTYTPNPGFLGLDTFIFRACGFIASQEVCDDATAEVSVSEASQTQADPQQVTTALDTQVEITLTGTAGTGGSQGGGPEAAFLDGAEMAGNVADSDLDGLGDNHNDLPGPVPILMSSGVDSTGGPGSEGTKRMQIEWDLTDLRGLAAELESASVILHTLVGSVDSLETYWFEGIQDQDGQLTDPDFEAPVNGQSPLAVMPVPDLPPNTEGTFSFDVFDELRQALLGDQAYFSIQGRVDESLAGQGFQRGLQVRTSADGNLAQFLEPQLSVATPGVVAPPLFYSILSLPSSGALFDQFQNPIVQVPATLPSARVTYLPSLGFIGMDAFEFEASDGVTAATAAVSVIVQTAVGLGDCSVNIVYCDDGRSDGGATLNIPDTEVGPPLSVVVEGPGDVSSNPRQIVAGEPAGLFCSRECTAWFPDGEVVALFARPSEASSEFVSWSGDCGGDQPMTLVRMHGARRCTATFRMVDR